MIAADLHDHVAVLTLEHGRANALDLELCCALRDELPELTAEANSVVMTARGSIFSAGVDLLRILDGGTDYVLEFLTALSSFCETVFAFPKPLVAAINGHAIAGGCVLACLADRRVMSREAGRVGVPELLVGVPFPAAPLEVLRFVVPKPYFQEIVYGGRTYDAAAGKERGLIDEVVAPDRLLDHAIEAARDMGRLPAAAFQLTKAQVRQHALDRMRIGAAHDDAVRAIWTAPETMAGIRSYVEKTFKRPNR